MSAPLEVWQTIIDGDDGNPFIVDGNTYKRLDGDVRYLRADLVLGLLREAQEYMTHAPICRGMPKCNCGYRDLDRRIDAILAGKEPRP